METKSSLSTFWNPHRAEAWQMFYFYEINGENRELGMETLNGGEKGVETQG